MATDSEKRRFSRKDEEKENQESSNTEPLMKQKVSTEEKIEIFEKADRFECVECVKLRQKFDRVGNLLRGGKPPCVQCHRNGILIKGTLNEKSPYPSQTDTSAVTADDEEHEERAAWGGKLEFLFTCIGYAVGLGNVWRFPYLCYKNGGGAFLVPYIIMLGFVGLPLFFMELAFGQFASLGPITIWKINPVFKGLGYAMVIVSWLIGLYYNVVISHVLLYLFASFASIPTYLPWINCNNTWNTPDCIPPTYDEETRPMPLANVTAGNATLTSAFNNATMMNITMTTAATIKAVKNHTLGKTPAEEYYEHFVLESSGGIDELGPVNWKLALCLLLSWIIVFICLIRGIQSLGKVVYFTAIFPYIMLTILLIRGVTLPGAGVGISFYLKPDFSKLGDPRVWSDAATQIFYSLSACSGGLIAMSSYNKFDNNCYRDSLIVALINCGTSIYAGFVIFAILGFMATEKGVGVEHVAQGGPGLAFVVYPEAISRMPAPQLWAVFFFFMMATLGFGSQFSIMECVMSAFTDEFSYWLRPKKNSIIFRSCIIFGTFLLGLPMVTKGGIYLLNLVDYSVSGFPLLVIGFMECTAVNWVYGFRRFSEDIRMMLGSPPNLYWRVTWVVMTPTLIFFTIIFNIVFYKDPTLDDYEYPGWARSLCWLITFFPLSFIIGFFFYRYCKDGGWTFTKEVTSPLPDWGPALAEHRTDMYAPVIVPPPVRMVTRDADSGEMNYGFQKSKESLANLSVNTSGQRTPVYRSTPQLSVYNPSPIPNMLEQTPGSVNNILQKSIMDNARHVFNTRKHSPSETSV